ncbi:protein of unknown function [Micromonospora pattaloongensis]|uniref:DUF4383 domain-containing protein n=1 Tax=Micromonospora pattaloongensis TaxID=405436 RepID=A0A1H3GL50_9ACTN|nr:DUF4383 domain-containing protein [Micromonospora pattaloongensis]SDY03224.1 protein of unknown function [Micromonospora pattaloongensis]
MAHNPVNHPARPIYRAIGGLTGIYLVIFGVLGFIQNSGEEFFAQDAALVLGQGTNRGYALVSVAVGALILIGTGIGRNLDAAINKLFGYLFMLLGLAELALLRTDANFFGFSIVTVIVVMIIGLVLLTAGMYGKVGTEEQHRAWQDARLNL